MKNSTLTLAMILACAVHALATPLHDTSAKGTAAVITALVDAGARPNARDAFFKTPFVYALYNESLKGTDAYSGLKPSQENPAVIEANWEGPIRPPAFPIPAPEAEAIKEEAT